jgi:hypothetical protein
MFLSVDFGSLQCRNHCDASGSRVCAS